MTMQTTEWKKTACILCSLNCGLEVQTGGEDGRRIIKIRGDDEQLQRVRQFIQLAVKRLADDPELVLSAKELAIAAVTAVSRDRVSAQQGQT